MLGALAPAMVPASLLRAAGAATACHGRSLTTWPGQQAGLHTSSSSSAVLGGYMGTGTPVPDAEDPQARPTYLVTGACGQIGRELVAFLRSRVGPDNVIASDVKTNRRLLEGGPFSYCDVQDRDNLARIVLESGVTHIVHLATLLSAVGERNPSLALKVNTVGIQNVLELAKDHGLCVYAPSTIAVFGALTPRRATPDDTITRPSTMYGITKVHQELLGQYYADRYGVDYRSLRYPGIISSAAAPGGGTTDYAVDIFHEALRTNAYTCFLSEDAELPMMYMPDCLEATWQLMCAPRERLTRTTYNITAASFSPAQLAAAIAAHSPGFAVRYQPDFRDDIARSWPASIDDSCARRDWGWAPRYGLPELAQDMLSTLAPRYGRTWPLHAEGAAAAPAAEGAVSAA